MLTLCGILVVLPPALLVLGLGLALLLGRPPSERGLARLTQVMVLSGLVGAFGAVATLLVRSEVSFTLDLGPWVELSPAHFHFTIKFLFDRLSLPFLILAYLLCGTIGAFAARYLHRDPGFTRFFLLYAIFTLGMVVSSVAGTIETLFLGWELVGLSSALLVAFFQTRVNPARNGLRVWATYRFADGAFLLAALVLHHLTGAGDLQSMMGADWPDGVTEISSTHAFLVGCLLLIAAAGKSALVPFSGWLPRAMEGPTPSSAIFYGALSVHLGAFLLLRVGPLLDQSLALRVLVILLGAATALFAAVTVGAQTDIKSSLALASLLQVSIIFVEIGLGLRYLALLHIIGHASLRTLQLLRAPSLLKDFRAAEDNLGASAGRTGISGAGRPDVLGGGRPNIPGGGRRVASARVWLDRFALERGYLDAILDEGIVRPLLAVFRACDAWERRWVRMIAGRQATRRSRSDRPRRTEVS